jgi:hypothetical protein
MDAEGKTPLLFNAKNMYDHMKSKPHHEWVEELATTRWYANYGRTPLSPRAESTVFSTFSTMVSWITKMPMKYGSSGVEDVNSIEETEWCGVMNKFLPGSDLKCVCFDRSVSGLLNQLRLLMFGFLSGCSPTTQLTKPIPQKCIVVAVAKGYASSELYQMQSQHMHVVGGGSGAVVELQELSKKFNILAVVYDHMQYTDL